MKGNTVSQSANNAAPSSAQPQQQQQQQPSTPVTSTSASSTPTTSSSNAGVSVVNTEQGPIRATEAMFRCSRILQILRDCHPTVLVTLESIAEQVSLYKMK